MTKAKEIIESA